MNNPNLARTVFLDVSMAASATSAALPVDNAITYAIQVAFTGSPVGNFKLQASNNNSTWTDIAGSSQDISAAGDILWDVSNVGHTFVRCVYTRTSGSGTLNGNLEGRA